MIGLVYYGDDPHKRVFRIVYPEKDDAELDQPPTDGNRKIMCDAAGQPHSWTSFGVDPLRPVLMDKALSAAGRKRGTVSTPANEPVVYYVNTAALASLSVAQAASAWSFIAVNQTWKNFFDLGSGVPTVLLANATVISPSWIVIVDGAAPGIGTRLRHTTIGGHSIDVWSV